MRKVELKHPSLFAARPVLGLCLTGALALAGAETGVERSLGFSAYTDMGQVVNGSTAPEASAFEYEGIFLSRTAVSILFKTTVEDRLHMNVGVGGLFYRAFPIDQQAFWTKGIKFGPGISETSFQYDFGPRLSAKAGFFAYKYNPDARNLGEYLLRSEAYPSLVQTGGWSWLNSAAYQSLGAQLRWSALEGAWTNDFLIMSAFESTPAWDMSPSFISTLRVGKALEIGGGVSLHRWLPIKPSAERPRDWASTYVEVDGFPSIPALYDTVWVDDMGPRDPSNVKEVKVRQIGFEGGPGKTLAGMGSQIVTPAKVVKYLDEAGEPIGTAFVDGSGNLAFVTPAGDTLPSRSRRLTFQGIKLMARGSLDFKALLGLGDYLGPGDLRVFGEVAVLGVENQPHYYENIRERIPMMFGVNIPTFKALDLLSLQVQYYGNPWPDSKQLNFSPGLPIPADLATRDEPAIYRERLLAGAYSADDWKWSLFASRTLTPGLQLQVQAANDHFRMRKYDNEPNPYPLTNRRDHWYYIFRLVWGV